MRSLALLALTATCLAIAACGGSTTQGPVSPGTTVTPVPNDGSFHCPAGMSAQKCEDLKIANGVEPPVE